MLQISGHTVGPGNPCFVIAEIGQNHDGSLGTAHAYIDAVARSGAQAIKFQTHIADAESTQLEPFRIQFSYQDKSRYDYWRRMEFTAQEWRGLAEHAAERELVFLSTAFSVEAVDLLDGLGMAAWKVASGEIENFPLLERMARTGRPVLLSSGMTDWTAFDRAVACVRALDARVGVFQCTTAYPCPPERVGLNVLSELRARYACPVGLSDHSATIYAGLAAATMGADMLEVHVAFSRECFGPDVVASITTGELKQLVEGIKFIARAKSHPVDKEEAAAGFVEMRRVFGRSIVAARALPAGHELTAGDLACKKPGNGLPAERLGDVVHRTLKHALAADALVLENDLE